VVNHTPGSGSSTNPKPSSMSPTAAFPEATVIVSCVMLGAGSDSPRNFIAATSFTSAGLHSLPPMSLETASVTAPIPCLPVDCIAAMPVKYISGVFFESGNYAPAIL
jgi:hypothetical protein